MRERSPGQAGYAGRATAIGYTAILMWATLALLTKLSGEMPPFQLTAMSFTLAFLIGVAFWLRQGGPLRQYLQLPPVVWAIGLFGLFGYHCFYFIALQNAPAVNASLIAYLWPLLIVVFSAVLPGERLAAVHLVGGLLGFVGAGLLVTQDQSLSWNSGDVVGYLAALACAVIWASYSILSRYFGAIPTHSVGGFCGVTAILAWICHWAFESTVVPVGWEWGAIAALGLGPVGLAFFTWDYGVKQGHIKTLGALSYTAPLLSTLLLIATGFSDFSWQVGLACGLIVGGAAIASRDRPNR